LARNSMEGQGELIHLAKWREEDSIRLDKHVLACSVRFRKRERCRPEVFFLRHLD
jgi:hypothetical protein